MVPLTQLQKKLYMSVLRKELPTLISFTRGSSRHQSLQNIVILFLLMFSCKLAFCMFCCSNLQYVDFIVSTLNISIHAFAPPCGFISLFIY